MEENSSVSLSWRKEIEMRVWYSKSLNPFFYYLTRNCHDLLDLLKIQLIKKNMTHDAVCV